MNLKYFHERAIKELNDFRDLFNLTAAEKHISLGDLANQPESDVELALLKEAAGEPSDEDLDEDEEKQKEELKILVE